MIPKDLLKEDLLQYDIPVTDEQLDALDKFSDLLVDWNGKINLTAITDPEGIARKHFLDSLLIFKFADFKKNSSVIDVGCGAGFPSMPMLIFRNDLKMTFLDSTKKKLGVIDNCLEELELEAETVHSRAEEAARGNMRESYDYAVARAVANLRTLCEYTLPFVKPGGYFIALKGKEGEEELKEAGNAIEMLGGKLEALNCCELPDGSKRTIILIKKISQTSPKYPRASSVISKKPL